MKTISGLSATLAGLDKQPLKDMIEPAKNPCTTCGQNQVPAVFQTTTVAEAIARSLVSHEEAPDPVRSFDIAMSLHKAGNTLNLDADDHTFVQKIMADSKLSVLAKAQCLIVLNNAKQKNEK